MERRFDQTKTFGMIAIVYAIVLTAVLSFRFAHHFGDFTAQIESGDLTYVYQDGWSFLYFFTWQSNLLVVFWLVAYGITRFKWQNSAVAWFTTHNITLVFLALSTTLLFVYGMVVVWPYFILEGFHVGRHLHMPFVYFATPLIVWMIFLYDERKSYPRMSDAFYVMAYPIVYFGVSMIIGHLTFWSDTMFFCEKIGEVITIPGDRAFPYPQFDPAFWPSVGAFIGFVVGFLLLLLTWSFVLIRIVRRQWRKSQSEWQQLVQFQKEEQKRLLEELSQRSS